MIVFVQAMLELELDTVRYRIDAAPGELATPVVEHALLFGAVLGVIIGITLFAMGRRGRIMWLTVWSVGLTLSGAAYMAAAFLGKL